jgi:hypothetical protein
MWQASAFIQGAVESREYLKEMKQGSYDEIWGIIGLCVDNSQSFWGSYALDKRLDPHHTQEMERSEWILKTLRMQDWKE